MISEKENTRISKFLSLVLRHQPETIGIELDENGWTNVTELLEKTNAKDVAISFDILKHVVATNKKKRFAFNDSFDKIRANQGHSVNVELNYQAKTPPHILYHGTAEKNIEAILKQGLQKMKRHHVHLSRDEETAINVGQRHGKPVVIIVDAKHMHEERITFYESDNGVWLTDEVAPKYLSY